MGASVAERRYKSNKIFANLVSPNAHTQGYPLSLTAALDSFFRDKKNSNYASQLLTSSISIVYNVRQSPEINIELI